MNGTIRSLSTAAMVVAAVSAHAGIYDFDDRNRNDMAGAWTACEDQFWQPMECAMVQAKCWQYPLIYYRRGKIKTYCKKDPIFSGTAGDGQKALDDARRMLPRT